MQVEFEATFLDVNPQWFRNTLKEKGATLVHEECDMVRVVFHPPTSMPGTWLRVRKEYNQVTMSIKSYTGGGMDDQKEVDVVIDSFEQGRLFLASIGAKEKAYQETKRELWKYKHTAISIDTWPGLDPFVEVEVETEAQVKLVAEAFGFAWKDAIFGDASVVYEQSLGISRDEINNHTPVLSFANPPQKRKS